MPHNGGMNIARPRYRLLFVCMGNICRSPTAHGVMAHMVRSHGMADWVEVDSAGTHNYHPGEPPDERSQANALKRGYDPHTCGQGSSYPTTSSATTSSS
jgi:protein-tyrosine phosphatase